MTEFTDLYPFESHFIDIDGLKYHYIDEGQGDVIVMLHGNPTWSFYYRNLALSLRESHRVIVPDHIGCGFSDKPQNYPYRLEDHVSNLKRMITSLNIDKFHLFLHDWGGPIGLGYAVDFPEKIEKLVIFNTACSLNTQFPLRILLCRIPVIGEFLVRRFNYFALAAAYMASKNREKMTPAVKAGYLKPYDSYSNRIANIRFIQDIPLTTAHPTWKTAQAIESGMTKLRDKSIMICWGDKDFCFTEHFLDQWKRHFPDAEVHRFPDAGHYVLEDAIDEIIPLVNEFIGTDRCIR